jgi:SAM-dependent methyltransferase
MQGSRSGRAYYLPSGAKEVDRLDIQHYALALMLGGHYLAPVNEPRHILDVGCGTGQWCFDMCELFPDAIVVGLDPRNDSKTTEHANYRFVRGDVIAGLPFEAGTFAFVHQRLLISGIPLMRWSSVVNELARVTRPGGWLELVECRPFFTPEGPATKRIWDMFRPQNLKRGIDMKGHVHDHLDEYLRDAGLCNVNARTVLGPAGDWGDEVGRLMKVDLRSLFTQLAPMLAQIHNIKTEQVYAMIQEMLDEFETVRPYGSQRIAYGQKRT